MSSKSSSSPSINLDKYVLIPKDLSNEEKETNVSFIHPLAVTPSMAVSQKKNGKKSKYLLCPGDGKTWSTISQGIPHIRLNFKDNKPYTITQSIESNAFLTSSNVAFQNIGLAFAVTVLTQIASFQNIFDQYKIDCIELWIIPRNPTSPTGAAVNRGLLYSCIDYDDQTVAGYNETNYTSRSNVVVTNSTLGHYRRFVPHTAVAAYSSSGPGFTGYQNEVNQWIDASYPSVLHYGVKVGVSICDAAADEVVYDQLTRYTVSWRNVQ